MSTRRRLDIIPEKSKVILIGTSQYDYPQDFPNIAPVEGNIRDLNKVFSNGSICGIKNIVQILNKDSHEIQKEFAKESSDIEDTLLVYYTGHGHRANGKKLFLTGKDSQKEYLKETCINFETIYERCERSNAQKKIIFLDCCYSGIATQSGGGAFAEELELKEVKGVYIMAASLSNKKAEFDENEKHTYFTGQLIQLLENGIETDHPLIHLDEAFTRVKNDLLKKGKPEPSRSNKLSESEFYLFNNVQYQGENGEITFDLNDPKFLNKAPFSEMPSNIIAKKRVVKEIEEKMAQSNHAPLYIKGIGGLGKTTFAQAYTWRHREKYDKIAWVNVQKNNFQGAFITDEKLLEALEANYIKADAIKDKFGEVIKNLLKLNTL